MRFDYFYNGKQTLRGRRRKDLWHRCCMYFRGGVWCMWCIVLQETVVGGGNKYPLVLPTGAFCASLVHAPLLLPRSPSAGFVRLHSHLALSLLPGQLHKAIVHHGVDRGRWEGAPSSRAGAEGGGEGTGPKPCAVSSLCLLWTYATHSQDFIFQ